MEFKTFFDFLINVHETWSVYVYLCAYFKYVIIFFCKVYFLKIQNILFAFQGGSFLSEQRVSEQREVECSVGQQQHSSWLGVAVAMSQGYLLRAGFSV